MADHEALTQRALYLIGSPRNRRYGFLAGWSSGQLARLITWLELGVRIDGPWKSEELMLVLGVLDDFGATFGKTRFAEIARAAIAARSDNRDENLWLVKERGEAISVAAWYPTAGRVRVNDRLFDNEVLAASYRWPFLTGPYVQSAVNIDIRRVIVGHEFGHLVIDGLRVEAATAGYQGLSPEDLYASTVDPAQWPHGLAPTNENLATEIAVWALGIKRTPEVQSFRDAFLNRTIESAAWPAATAALFAQVSAHGGR